MDDIQSDTQLKLAYFCLKEDIDKAEVFINNINKNNRPLAVETAFDIFKQIQHHRNTIQTMLDYMENRFNIEEYSKTSCSCDKCSCNNQI